MNLPAPPVLFWVFFAVWIVLGIGSAWFFLGSRHAKLKKRVFPWFVAGGGALFALFVLLLSGQPDMLLIVVPAVVLISYQNIRMTKFCESCGATIINHSWFTKMRYCSRCGAALDGIEAGSAEEHNPGHDDR